MFDGQHRSFDIQSDGYGTTIPIKINETPGVSAENLSLATWGSSYILANRLYTWKEHVTRTLNSEGQIGQGKTSIPILEVGAGTSLVGLSAAAIYKPSQPLPVIVTDLEPLIPGLEANIVANPELVSAVKPGVLDWWNPQALNLQNSSTLSPDTHQAPFILAADTVYDEDHPHLLTGVINTWLARNADARVIMCYVLRHSYIDIIRDLWERFEEAGLECVEEGQVDPDPDKWDDVAPFEWCVWRWKNGKALDAKQC